MLKTLFQSLKKSKRLKRISRELSKPISSKDLIEQTFEKLRKDNKENVNIEFDKENYVGRTLAHPVFKDRKDDFVDDETGEVITTEEIEKLRKNTSGGVTQKEFKILREELYPIGTVLTLNIIEDIISTSYSWVYLYKTEPTLNDTEKNYLEELIDFAESDKYVKMVMDEYNADRKTLKELYSKLILVGAGQYAKGHYVAASSLIYPLTLKFLLEHFEGENFSINGWDAQNSAMHIAFRLIEYFEKGEIGEVK